MSDVVKDRVFLMGQGPYAGACATRLAVDGFDTVEFATDVSAEELVGAAASRVPFGMVSVLEDEIAPALDWGTEWRAGVGGVLRCAYAQTRALARLIMRERRGRIVYVVSADGLVGSGGDAALAVASAAIAGMARSVARELAPRSVTVNTVAYGTAEDTPLGRCPSQDEVAAMVGYLMSDAGAAVCGQVLSVDAGMVMR